MRPITTAKQILLEKLEAYRGRFKEACKEKGIISDLEIADVTFWTDYVNNWKAFKDKTKSSKQKPMKIWKEIPEIVLESLNEFRQEFKRFSLLSNKKLLRETHHTWRHLKKEMDKRNLQIFREKTNYPRRRHKYKNK